MDYGNGAPAAGIGMFNHPEFDNHEEVIFACDPKTGLKVIIAIHNTVRGPALGGCRIWPYESEEEALYDVLRLSRGMTYKAAISNLKLGGGKAVILKDPSLQEVPPPLILSFAKQVEKMGGRYITAEDVGTTAHHMELMRQETSHVVGLPRASGAGRSGNPSPVTAYGVYRGIMAAVRYQLGQETLEGIKVAVQGAGNVGFELSKLLQKEGAIIYVNDINEEAVKRTLDECGATAVGMDEIYELDVDVFAPCALGGSINDNTIPRLKASIVAGSANNQLRKASHGKTLMDRGILYAPDYVINAGGLINVTYEVEGGEYSREVALQHVESIYDTLMEIFILSEKKKCPTSQAADEIAETRFKK